MKVNMNDNLVFTINLPMNNLYIGGDAYEDKK